MASCKCWQAIHIEKRKKLLHLHISQKILWQVLCHGQLIFLLSTWRMDKNFANPDFFSCSSLKKFPGVRIWYYNKIPIIWVFLTFFSGFLVHWWRWKISPKRVAALIFSNPSGIAEQKTKNWPLIDPYPLRPASDTLKTFPSWPHRCWNVKQMLPEVDRDRWVVSFWFFVWYGIVQHSTIY